MCHSSTTGSEWTRKSIPERNKMLYEIKALFRFNGLNLYIC